MSTRGNDPKTVRKVIIMQRLHDRDLTGHVLSEERGYQHLCLPAEYEPKRIWWGGVGKASPPPTTEDGEVQKVEAKPRDAIVPTVLQKARPELRDGPEGSGRKAEGDPLWEARFGKQEIAKLKAELRAMGWSGQGQQRPSPEEGTIFQSGTFRYFDEVQTLAGLRLYLGVREDGMPPPFSYLANECRWFQCVDTALTIGQLSAWTCVGTFALTPCRKLLVWDIWRERLLVPKQFKAIQQMRDGKGVYDPVTMRWTTPGKARPWPSRIMYQAVENKASGIGLIQTAQLEGSPFRVLKADTDKVKRAASLATMFEGGCVYFRNAARSIWLTDYEGELLSFPGGAFADQVDVSSYAAIMATTDSLTNSYSRVEGPLIVSGGDDDDMIGDEQREARLHSYISTIADSTIEGDDRPWWQR